MPLTDAETLYREAMALDAAGEYGRSARLYKELVASSEDPRHFVAYGACLQRLGHWEQSVAPLERGVELKPHYCEPDARIFLAESYLRTNRKDKAIQQWRVIEGMPPEYPSYELPAKDARAKLELHDRKRPHETGA